jgi:dynein heavy chain 1
MTLFNLDAFTTNLFRIVTTRRKQLVLEVNFDQGQAELCNEARSLSLLGFKLIPSIETFANTLQRIYPFAMSMSEAIRLYFHASARIDPTLEPLLASAKSKMHCYLKLGLDHKLAAAWKVKDLQRELKRDFERHPRFLDEFVRKREFEHLELYSRKLYDCALAFQGKVADMLAKMKAVEAALVNLQKCALEKEALHRIVDALQGIVSEMELSSYSNLAWWVKQLDKRIDVILLARLEELVRIWMQCFRPEMASSPSAFGPADADIAEHQPTEYFLHWSQAARSRLEIKIKNSVLFVDPPVENARAAWVNHLSASMEIITEMPRIRHSAYSEFSDMYYETKKSTYQALVYKLPASVMQQVYRMIDEHTTSCERYIGSWLNYQALWDLDSSTVIAKIGHDLSEWLAVVTELRASRLLFETEETFMTFGAITVDFARVQSGVVAKFDAWHKEMMLAFAALLQDRIRKMLLDLKNARESLEHFSADKGTSDAVEFLNGMQVFKTDKISWETDVKSLREGERTLQKHRFKFANDWTYVEMIEGEWMAFVQIYSKKEIELADKLSSLQAKVFEWDKSVSERINIAVNEWSVNKPIQGNIPPADALDQLSIFQTSVKKLQQDHLDIVQAKEALGMEILSGIKLSAIVAEMADLREVWLSLVQPHSAVLALGDTAWNAVIPRKVRSSLEEIQASLRSLPNMIRQYAACEHISTTVTAYLKSNAFIIDLRSQAMKERHWDILGNRLNMRFNPSEMTLRDVWSANIHLHESLFKDVLSKAQGEFGLEEYLKQLRESWQIYQLDLVSYQHKVSLIRGWDDLFTQLNENLNSLSSMRTSPYFMPFKDEASKWEGKLNTIRDTFTLWAEIQRRWVYLEGIFLHSCDIKNQLPLEHSHFMAIDNDFVSLMRQVAKKPSIMDVVDIKDVQTILSRLDELLCRIQKSLADYLEGKRSSFPRFYFVGDDDLLEIIGSGKEPAVIQRHFRKMFSGIQSFVIEEEGSNLTAMQSAQGEVVPFRLKVSFAGAVEVNAWLSRAEEQMRLSLSADTEAGVSSVVALTASDFSSDQLFGWIDSCSLQVAVVAMQILACQKIEADILASGHAFVGSSDFCKSWLRMLADAVLKDLSAIRRKKAEHCIGELVHQQNMIQILVHKNTLDLGDFSWLYFLRVYYRASEKSELERLQVLVADASFLYGFEYQGVADRLVQTPLTDRAFLVLTQALRSRMGGSPFGPAGTGKTETVKALAGQLGRFVLVFNCDETFDLQSMGRIFLGLCQTGAWGCFDEFNRLEERILSAVSQQILIIQTAVRRNYAQVELIGRSLTLNPNIGIFITMNPGYIGRSNLPDNLKQLFRSVAMTKPDSEMIAEIMLYSQGFQDAAMLSRKIVPLFKLCAEQLSPCSHYDFGLRALKSVLVGSGQLKRTAIATAAATAVGQAQEISIIVKSFCGAVIPKLLPDDVVLLQSLLRDVFPGAQEPDFSDDAICEAIVGVCRDWKFQLSDLWLKKVMQLSQIVNLNHGVMLVGPSGSGKSAACRVLFEALRRIDIESEKKPGSCFHQLDPKALSKSALYGTLDPTTREWTDGVLTKILREIVDGHRGDKDGRHWIVLDGDVDPEWIENLNSVLDDNRLLTLPTGERIVVPGNVRIIFEVQDLQFATLATVSRCGMVWFSQDTVTHSLLLSRYLSCLVSAVAFSSWDFSRKTNLDPSVAGTCAKVFEALLDRNGLLEKALVYVAAYDHVMAFSMQQALNALFSLLSEGVARAQDYHLDRPGGPLAHNVIEKFISKHTLVCIVCSLGGSLDLQHRELFAKWIGGITTIAVPSSDRSLLHYEVNVSDGEWLALDSKVPSIDIETNRIVASDVLITTIDTVRHEQLLKSWLKNRQPVLLCGPPGSGKTMTITACLRAMPDAELVSLNFSSTSSPDLLMITFEHYCTYSKSANGGTVLRPNMGGKWLVIFCDEVNLPAPDKYGTQHVIAMLRQCIEHGGFWRASDLSWVKLERIQFVAACNPPTDAGRTVLTPRFLRHTPLLYVDFPGKESLQQIYGTLSKALLKLAPALSPYAQPLTDALVDYYTLCKDHFNRDMQPHYIYSPRELSRWMRAMYEAMRSKDMVTPEFLVQLVMHEGLRLFQDRLVDEDERSWADSTINSVICKYFPTIDHQGCLVRPLLLCNWLTREYAQVQQTALRDFVKARLRVFYEEELNVPLVVFDQVLDHVLRIDRVLRQPLGHVLLIGASGSGKTVLSRFVAWHNGYSVFQIKAHRGYGQTDFEADLRKVMKRSGCKGETVCFIFDESNILSSGFLELMNALLASGEVPGLFDGEEWPVLMQQCKEAAQRDGVMVDSEDQLYKRFIQQVQANLHIVFTMNPASSDYSNRTATSPALFNRCVVNWVGDWSGDALRQVAHEFTASLDLEIGCEPSAQGEADLRDSVVGALVFVHKAVQRVCERRIKHHDELLFVTPRHYVDFIQQFVRIFEEKRSEIEEQQLHLNVGLRRLTETQEAVQELGVSLEAKEKELAAKEVEANDKLQQMVHDQQEAEKQKAVTAQLKVKVRAFRSSRTP